MRHRLRDLSSDRRLAITMQLGIQFPLTRPEGHPFHEPGNRLEQTASSPQPSPPEEERENGPALGCRLAMCAPITVAAFSDRLTIRRDRHSPLPFRRGEGRERGPYVRRFRGLNARIRSASSLPIRWGEGRGEGTVCREEVHGEGKGEGSVCSPRFMVPMHVQEKKGASHELRKHPTSNIEHPTSNDGARSGQWMLDVRCWMLDVLCPRFRGPICPLHSRRDGVNKGGCIPSSQEQSCYAWPAFWSSALCFSCRGAPMGRIIMSSRSMAPKRSPPAGP